jgi:MoaA/NifB/PqqE/SkfB family radical SAM enzyme
MSQRLRMNLTPKLSDYYNDLTARYMDQPNEIALETTALCNAACTFCPYPTLDRKGEKMPDDLIEKVIEDMAQFEVPFHFSPFKVNEPLLDPRLIDICELVEDFTIATLRIFTNGAALTEKKILAIAGLQRVDHLWVSLNEYREAEYEALMAMPFERTAKRLDVLHRAVDHGVFRHKVVLSTVGFPNEPFREYCYERWPLFQSLAIQKSGWLGYTDPQVDTVPDTPCGRWFEMSITSTGIVSHCCMHDGQETKYNIGDIREQTLLEIYNSPFWRERREKLVSRRDLDERSPCSRCTY